MPTNLITTKTTPVNLSSNQLQELSNQLRAQVIELSALTRTPHLGSSLSCMDILVALYFYYLKFDPNNLSSPGRDRFILSKGHAAAALYAVFHRLGIISGSDLELQGTHNARLEEHPNPHSTPGIEAATGSLGHGLSIGCGMALSARIQQHSYRVVTLMSDGECNEGSVWEAAMFASAQRLNNMTAFVDFNGWQATGRSREVMDQNRLAEKWQSFGWDATDLDGHDIGSMIDWLETPTEKPRIAIAHTTKGKGVSFMEDDNNWHYRIPNSEEVTLAKQELGVSDQVL